MKDRMPIVTHLATGADIESVGALLEANSAATGGSLTGHWSKEIVAQWLARGATIVVAHEGATLLGALLADEKVHATAPVVRKMLEAWRGTETAYVYGPVCVAREGRGKGVLEALYLKAGQIFAGREAILFIRTDNTRSLRAHEKLGMRRVAEFSLDDIPYFVLSDAG